MKCSIVAMTIAFPVIKMGQKLISIAQLNTNMPDSGWKTNCNGDSDVSKSINGLHLAIISKPYVIQWPENGHAAGWVKFN